MQGTIISSNAAISACERCDEWQRALSLFKHVNDLRLDATIITFGAAISACESGAQWHRATELKQGCPLCFIVSRVLCHRWLSLGKHRTKKLRPCCFYISFWNLHCKQASGPIVLPSAHVLAVVNGNSRWSFSTKWKQQSWQLISSPITQRSALARNVTWLGGLGLALAIPHWFKTVDFPAFFANVVT